MACRLTAAQKDQRADPPTRNPRKENIMETITTQGVAIPRLGFGTFRMPGADAQPVVESAIALGYRHIDTAAMYDNEASVGAAIAASGAKRNELFITTKVWHDQLAPDVLCRAFHTSLRKLRLDQVDLYMIHWPSQDMDMVATLKALMSLRERRLTRAIGVCNFNLPMIRRAVEEIGAPIAGLQVEYHPFLSQAPMLAYLRGKGIPLTAYAPLAQGRAASDPTLASLGRKHGCSAAQMAVAWLLDQKGVIVIPKASRSESQKANLDALGTQLDEEDRTAIAALPKDQRFVRPPFAPDWDAIG
jgi:2,5-diketo-D-gluconate reductase B